jgi:hypothetical protein
MLSEVGYNFPFAVMLVALQGIVFIPLMPLSFDYGCDILFPAGEAQITGCLMTSGNFLGVVFVNLSLFRSSSLNKPSDLATLVIQMSKISTPPF